MKILNSTILVATSFLLFVSSADVQANMIYSLRTETTNGDSAKLVAGFFETDGTTGTNLALGSILTAWSIEIMEGGATSVLNETNSSVVLNDAFFDVTSSTITLTNGPESFRGLRINSNADSDIRYAAVRTTNKTNVFVSINSGAGTLTGTARDFVIAVPEPTSLVSFSTVAVLGLARRRRKKSAT